MLRIPIARLLVVWSHLDDDDEAVCRLARDPDEVVCRFHRDSNRLHSLSA